jgi:CheY-like chemotaxis protein
MDTSLNNKSRRSPFPRLAFLSAGALLVASAGASTAASADGVRGLGASTAQSAAAAAAIVLVAILLLKRRARSSVVAPVQRAGPGGLPTPAGQPAAEADQAELLTELRSGPSLPLPPALARGGSRPAPLSPARAETTREESDPRRAALDEFYEWAPRHVSALQRVASQGAQAPAPEAQRAKLAELCDQVVILKKQAGLPELRPAWQLCVALEGLLGQLSRRVNDITQSTLRTIENAAGLLSDLCVPGVRADLADYPSIRILTVDDDPISGATVLMALKKAFEPPDLSPDGEGALALARQQRYDLITLDVMMPKMDGFEVCAKIRETPANRSTPILFITALKDFESRTRLLATGGNEVMGKPFLPFEITVKALTLILRARLRNGTPILEAIGGTVSHSTPAVDWPSLKPFPAAGEPILQADQPRKSDPLDQANPASTDLVPPPVFEANTSGSEDPPKEPRQTSQAFVTYLSNALAEMKQRVAELGTLDDPAARQEGADRLHLGFQGLSRALSAPELKPAFEVSRSLEGLFNKLVANPRSLADSSLATVTAGMELLQDMCAVPVRADLADKPPIRFLVVDDEPLARRALTGALQMAFPRPASVETGEAALALAREQEFDLVFMDVCMPGMDGFTACSKIHETPHNHSTPVVFVTSHSDQEFRARAVTCGGYDFVAKPFVFAEIGLKALTIALRSRMQKETTPPQRKPAQSL